ncbi:MAG TPA: DTW domain-containing protein, partial [Comamonas denitrificans]|nr:DTW domain-containing protein [Comamonas denitrificans]
MKKRFNCPRCLRPCSHCFCPLVQPVACGVELLILQHPLEHGHAKNTARLLHLCLPGSRLEVGECFDPAQLAQWLAAADKRSVLLYPPSA